MCMFKFSSLMSYGAAILIKDDKIPLTHFSDFNINLAA